MFNFNTLLHLNRNNTSWHQQKDTMYFNIPVKERTINIPGTVTKQPTQFYTVAVKMYHLMPIPLTFSITHYISMQCHSIKAFGERGKLKPTVKGLPVYLI